MKFNLLTITNRYIVFVLRKIWEINTVLSLTHCASEAYSISSLFSVLAI